MNEDEFEELLRMAVESETLDDPDAPDPRKPNCPSMSRLEALGAGRLPETAPERHHLAGCGICRARFAAFRAGENAAGRSPQPVTSTRATPWLMRVATFAAAAALLAIVQVSLDRGRDGREPSPGPVVGQAGILPISVCHDPALEPAWQPRIDHFLTTADESCVVVAVFRAWNETCQCLDWRLHEWGEAGRTLAELDPDEMLDIALNVSDNPPVGQLLVLASSRQPDDLPATSVDAEALLECLNVVAPPACPNSDVSAYASAVRACLPANVTLVAQTFVVE
ncbi:MAG: hypothetical protein KKB50_13135 [Planctomycetes bacterium]|nr:hypothetical protein [Planctomycetota bacterium]